MKKWIVPAIIIIGLLAFALIVWFAFPLIGFGDFAPFEDVLVRLAIILVVWLIVGLFYGIRFLLRRRAAKKLEESLTADAGDTDSKVLSDRMVEALATLKSASGKSNYLYSLPWYIIIGPPGAGKTTALLKSGLKFPLAGSDGGASIAGTGGTRYCDWWFTDEAVLVDTAGRYTTQDSDADADKKSWLSFLSMLKRNRPKQPINGVIVAISLEDVMTLPLDQLAAHSAAIRKRLIEMHQQLKIDFPVYALFTKADLVAGFNEYFGNFTEARRRKVWGATFQTEDRKKNSIGKVPEEFDALVKRLTEELPDRLQEEPDAISRISIFGFPGQVAMLKERVNEFLRQIFEPNRYQVNANLRGFYMSSGTQEGTPIDQVLGVMDKSFGGGGQGMRSMSGIGKSYFIHDLFRSVIFNETGWVSLDMAAIRRSSYFRWGVFGAVGLIVVLALAGWAWSFTNNDSLLKNTQQFVADYRVNAAEELNATSVSDTDVMKVLPALDQLRDNPVGYEHKDEGTPVGETFGLSQRDRLVVASEESYRQALERMFRSRLILRLEDQLNATMDDPNATYQALKVYMMLGGKAPKTDVDFIVNWMDADWAQLYPGSTNKPARDELEQHLRAMLALDTAKKPSFDLNGILIDSAQKTLTRLSLADQAYGYIKSLTPETPIDDFNVALRAGPESDQVFETVDGSDLNTLIVPALYTYKGFHDHFLAQLSSVADQLAKEDWVRGEVGKANVSDQQFQQLGPQLLNLYSRDFIDTWSRVLNNIKLKTLPGTKPGFEVLQVASNTVSSPIKQLIQAIANETALTKDDPNAPAPDAEDKAQSDAQKLIKQKLLSQAQGLGKIGINYALTKAQGRPGDANAPAEPGANIEAQFKPYADVLQGAPTSAADGLIQNLYDIYSNLTIAATSPSQADQANAATQTLIGKLRLSSSRFPPEFRKMIDNAVADLEGDAAGSNLAQLNDDLANNITRICQQDTENLYPFVQASTRDTPMGEFVRLFAPNGLMDTFFAQNLAKYADMSGDTWAWKTDTPLGQSLSANALLQFQRAAQIRDAFFPPGAQVPQINLTIGYAGLGQGVEQALLNIDGTIIQTQPTGSIPVPLQWPKSLAPSVVSISLQPDMPGRESTKTVQGTWALMRLIRQGTTSAKGNTMIVQYEIGGRGVAYRIQVDAIANPFFLRALSDFTCPTSL